MFVEQFKVLSDSNIDEIMNVYLMLKEYNTSLRLSKKFQVTLKKSCCMVKVSSGRFQVIAEHDKAACYGTGYIFNVRGLHVLFDIACILHYCVNEGTR